MRTQISFLVMLALATAYFLAGGSCFGSIAQSPSPRAAPAAEMRVDINHATIDDLLKVPGMTRTWAGRIVRFRPYRTKQDLLDQGIVTSEVYNRIKDYIIAHHEKQ